MFSLYRFLEKKREKKHKIETKLKEQNEAEDDVASVASEVDSVSDDEFNEYLDNLGAAGTMESDDENIDFLEELGSKMKSKDKKGKKDKKADGSDDDGSSDDDQWDDAGEPDSNEELDNELEIDSDAGSVSFDENELEGSDDDASVMTFSGDESDAGSDDSVNNKRKAKSNQMSEKAFSKKLKKANPESLFAAADDFSEMLEQSGKNSGKDHGTLGEIFNKDKSSLKQLAWEASKMNDFHKKKHHGGNKHGPPNKFLSNKKGGKKLAAKFQSGKISKGKKFDGKKFVTHKPVNRKFQKRK